MLEVRGCEGCSADDGDGCKIRKGKFSDLNRVRNQRIRLIIIRRNKISFGSFAEADFIF